MATGGTESTVIAGNLQQARSDVSGGSLSLLAPDQILEGELPRRTPASGHPRTSFVGPERKSRAPSARHWKTTRKTETVRFGVRSVRQSHHPELSLRLYGRQKNALFQRRLPNGLGTALAACGPFSLSLRPFSLQAGNCANLVLSLGSQQNQAISCRRNPAGSRVRLGIGAFCECSLAFPGY